MFPLNLPHDVRQSLQVAVNASATRGSLAQWERLTDQTLVLTAAEIYVNEMGIILDHHGADVELVLSALRVGMLIVKENRRALDQAAAAQSN